MARSPGQLNGREGFTKNQADIVFPLEAPYLVRIPGGNIWQNRTGNSQRGFFTSEDNKKDGVGQDQGSMCLWP